MDDAETRVGVLADGTSWAYQFGPGDLEFDDSVTVLRGDDARKWWAENIGTSFPDDAVSQPAEVNQRPRVGAAQ